jgi:hypothetical protein
MNRRVLAIYYSQSGQLEEIINSLCKPFESAGATVEKVRIYPENPYPFPWTGERFFSVMPDCVLGVPSGLQPFEIGKVPYDLIILGYQAWFLSPSIPSNSLLNHPAFIQALRNTPVVTITGARNMWISAMERVKKSISGAGGILVGNIALVDRHPNPVSFVTIFHWMFKGRKDRYLNIFPKPGVSDADILHAASFGEVILPHLINGNWERIQEELVAKDAVSIRYNLMFIESKARKIFALWAAFIAKRKKRRVWLVVFKYYLLIALFIAAPIILTVDAIFFRPFLSRRIRKQKQYLLGVN